MFKVCLLIALAIAGTGAYAQEGSAAEAAPEPYSYGYETDSHSASETKDPNGKVSGFYTIVDADGRQRRVDYTADESGFHANVQTNEVGTKTGHSADAEVQASQPNPEQYAYYSQGYQGYQGSQGYQGYQAPPVPPQPIQQKGYYYSQQVTAAPQVPVSTAAYTATSQQVPYGYGYAYQPGYYGYAGYGAQQAAPQVAYTSGYLAGNPGAVGYNRVQSGSYGNYNYHTPAEYYKSVGGVQPVAGAVGGRYVSSSVVGAAPVQTGSYRSSYQAVSGPGQVRYQTVASAPQQQTKQALSSNYIVLKKRDEAAAAEQKK